jgi:hypothetical protein
MPATRHSHPILAGFDAGRVWLRSRGVPARRGARTLVELARRLLSHPPSEDDAMRAQIGTCTPGAASADEIASASAGTSGCFGSFSPLAVMLPGAPPGLPQPAPRWARPGPSLVSGEPELFRRCIAESAHLCFVAAAPDGRLRVVNPAFASRLGCAPPALCNRDIWSLLADSDAQHLRLCVLHGWLPAPAPLLLTFVGAGGRFTLRCLVDVGADGMAIVGEPLCTGVT